MNLLRLKFGAVPTSIQDRLALADGDQLEDWAANVLTAASLEAVFAPAG